MALDATKTVKLWSPAPLCPQVFSLPLGLFLHLGLPQTLVFTCFFLLGTSKLSYFTPSALTTQIHLVCQLFPNGTNRRERDGHRHPHIPPAKGQSSFKEQNSFSPSSFCLKSQQTLPGSAFQPQCDGLTLRENAFSLFFSF